MDRIHLFACCHGFFEGKAVIIKLMNGVKKLLIGNLLLFKNHAVSLLFEGTGIQDLVTTACIGGQRDQEIGFMESTDLTDCISSCTGDYNVCQGKEIRQFVFDIFVLNISGSTGQFFVHFSLTAQMDHLEILQKFWKDLADMVINRGSTKTSTDDHKDWFISSETTELTAGFLITI